MILNKCIARRFSRSSQLGCSKIKELLDNAVSGIDETPQEQADIWSTSPYPEGTVVARRDQGRDQSKKAKRSGIDPKNTSIVLFPGQGSSYVGMAKNLVRIPEARDMFDIASQVLG